ncbi:hypothetical protein MMC22_005244 [Lobaria immixta]|nr:hypothetical protein [Lobaria immixta]
MSAGKSSLWKTILFPPLFALLLYLVTIHIFLPLYQRLRSRHHSSPLSSSLRSRLPSWFSLPSSLNNLSSRRRNSTGSGGESLLGDEELEEGLLDNIRSGGAAEGRDDGEGRLSRELEVGFRDESDDEEDDD